MHKGRMHGDGFSILKSKEEEKVYAGEWKEGKEFNVCLFKNGVRQGGWIEGVFKHKIKFPEEISDLENMILKTK